MPSADALQAWIRGAAKVFATTISGLAFETLPFLLFGTLLAAAIQAFVPDRVLRRVFPRNRIASIAVALVLGVAAPICECGTVPLAKRLRTKGLPLSTAAAFLLAAPLVNPMTIISTYVAFKDTGHRIFLYRLAVGLASALVIALVVEWATRRFPSLDIRRSAMSFSPAKASALPRAPLLRSSGKRRRSFAAKAAEALEHATVDFFDSARYLVLGISAAALVRVLSPRGFLPGGGSAFSAEAAGAASAYVLSLCSSADAFVARSLFAPASYAAVISFLVLGPMIDIKNTLLLSRFLRPKVLAAFVLLVFAVVIALSAAAYPLMEALP